MLNVSTSHCAAAAVGDETESKVCTNGNRKQQSSVTSIVPVCVCGNVSCNSTWQEPCHKVFVLFVKSTSWTRKILFLAWLQTLISAPHGVCELTMGMRLRFSHEISVRIILGYTNKMLVFHALKLERSLPGWAVSGLTVCFVCQTKWPTPQRRLRGPVQTACGSADLPVN